MNDVASASTGAPQGVVSNTVILIIIFIIAFIFDLTSKKSVIPITNRRVKLQHHSVDKESPVSYIMLMITAQQQQEREK